MNQEQARRLVDETFGSDFASERFAVFIKEFLRNGFDDRQSFPPSPTSTEDFHKPYSGYVESYGRLGVFEDGAGVKIDVLEVKLRRNTTLQLGRKALRNFAADYLLKGEGRGKQGFFAAAYAEDDETWRFSYVKLDSSIETVGSGRASAVSQKSEPKRFSFVAGAHESTHTVRKQFLPLLIGAAAPTIAKIEEAFSVEVVTRDFFRDYESVFKRIEAELARNIQGAGRNDKAAKEKRRRTAQRLLNRLMFIYFLQQKGWLSFAGDKNYLRKLFNEAEAKGQNFLADRLHWLFFHGLNCARDSDIGGRLKARIGEVPYLNGGLFEAEDEFDVRSRIEIENRLFADILNLFELYNFTVDESTPLDVELAVDPEMLGKVFEELVTGRQDTGSYYTPRQIVQFMCHEALKHYLEQTDIDPAKIKALIEDHSTDSIDVEDAQTLYQAISKVKIVDPACGSGAYLLGALQELKEVAEALDALTMNAPRDGYERKLKIIRDNLYGVEVDACAVQITRLRLWLSLVVDLSGDEPEPLPNLDFKIARGDSLIAPAPDKAAPGAQQVEIERYAQAKSDYFEAPVKRPHDSQYKKRLVRRIKNLRGKIAFRVHQNRDTETGVNAFDWASEFAEVFSARADTTASEGGFDIVLANPPYGAKVCDAVRDSYFDRRAEGPQSKDTYGLFMARGLQLLRPDGVLSYIVSDTWRTIKSHKPLRRRLLDTCTVKHFLDLPTWIFDATVNTCILTLTLRVAPERHKVIAGDLRNLPYRNWRLLEDNLKIVAARGCDAQTLDYARYTYPQSHIGADDNFSFFIASHELYRLMSAQGFRRLGARGVIKQGLITADNQFYLRKRPGVRGNYELVDEHTLLTREHIAGLSEDERLHGVEPQAYGGRHFLPYDKGGESEASDGWLPNYYVPTGYFIDWSREAVRRLSTHTSARQKGRIAARFQNRPYYFHKGITFSPTGIYSPTFRLGAEAIFGNKGSTIFLDDPDLLSYLAILTSMFSRYLLKNYLSHTVETGEEVLLNLPLPETFADFKPELAALVSSIMKKQEANQLYPYQLYEQKDIDALVYELYKLDAAQIREVEVWYCRRYPRLARAQGFAAEVEAKYAGYPEHHELLLAKPLSRRNSRPSKELSAES